MLQQLFWFILLLLVFMVSLHHNQANSEYPSFEEWQEIYGVHWPHEQEPYRRIIYQQKVTDIIKYNSDPTQTHTKTINQFSTLT